MKVISVIVLLIASIVCCGNKRVPVTITNNSIIISNTCIDNNKDSLTYKILTNNNKTYGYDILNHGKVLIHQASIPGVSGNKGFDSKNNAQKVAVLVIKKIRKGEMPPTVTKEELKKLGVLY